MGGLKERKRNECKKSKQDDPHVDAGWEGSDVDAAADLRAVGVKVQHLASGALVCNEDVAGGASHHQTGVVVASLTAVVFIAVALRMAMCRFAHCENSASPMPDWTARLLL